MLSLDLVVIGHIMMEKIYLSNGKVVGPVLGSPASYSSVAATLMGTKTGLFSIIGKDMPYYIVDPIITSGVDVNGLRVLGENSRSTKLVYDESGNKKIFYEKVAPDILFDNIPVEYLNTKAFFICPIDFEVPLETIFKIKKLNKLMMTDLGGYGGTVSTRHLLYGNKDDTEIIKDIVSSFNIVKTSSEDCTYLFDCNLPDEKIIKILHALGAEIVILTSGGKGSLISNGSQVLEIPAVTEKEKVDTTGAGDVYCAAFLSEYLRTKDLYKSGIYASTAATILIEKTGGVSLSRIPTDKEIIERMG